jgi:putative transposase
MKPIHAPRYACHHFPAEVISYAGWLYFRLSLSLRIVEEMLSARGILVNHVMVQPWARKFGQDYANQICRHLPAAGDKWSSTSSISLSLRREQNTTRLHGR